MDDYLYFDYAAATPMDERVLEAMRPFFAEKFYNPSATYMPALAVAKDIEAARGRVAHWLGARPSEIIFTAGGTEADNLAIHGVMRKYPNSNLIVSAIEHDAVLHPARDYDCREAVVDDKGVVDLVALRNAIDNQTVLISIMYANNEVGSIQPLGEVASIIREVRDERRKTGNNLPLYFHTDACQAGNYLDLHAARLGVDMMTVNGGKIYGPKQSGVLYVSGGIELEPLVRGGGQESGLRSGTENVPAIIGLTAALDIAQDIRHDEVRRLQELQKYFFEQLEAKVPQAAIHGSRKKRLPNNIHLTIPGHDNERLLLELENAGILAAAGSACSASNDEPSHVLKAMGVSDGDAQSSLRFSMGRGTTKEAVSRVVEALSTAVAGHNA